MIFSLFPLFVLFLLSALTVCSPQSDSRPQATKTDWVEPEDDDDDDEGDEEGDDDEDTDDDDEDDNEDDDSRHVSNSLCIVLFEIGVIADSVIDSHSVKLYFNKPHQFRCARTSVIPQLISTFKPSFNNCTLMGNLDVYNRVVVALHLQAFQS